MPNLQTDDAKLDKEEKKEYAKSIRITDDIRISASHQQIVLYHKTKTPMYFDYWWQVTKDILHYLILDKATKSEVNSYQNLHDAIMEAREYSMEVGRLITEKIPEHQYIHDMKDRDPIIATLKGKNAKLRKLLNDNGIVIKTGV